MNRLSLCLMLGAAAAACTRYDDDPALRDVSGQPAVFNGNETVIVGRSVAQADGKSVVSWAGSTLNTRFSGTSIIANIELVNGQKNNFARIILDGNDSTTIDIVQGTTQYTVSAEGEGPHALSIVKLNEAMDGTWLFGGFSPGDGGALLPTEQPTGRRIEFIGDSITCGYGNLGTITTNALTTSQNDTINSLRSCQTFLGKKVYEVSSAYDSFAVKTARNLNAQWHLTSWSGKGVYRNADATVTETMPLIWQRSVAGDGNTKEDLNAWVPQVVFIDLGTNDFGSVSQSSQINGGAPDLDKFRTAYTGMLKEIRTAWPNAWVFLAAGPMLSDYYPPNNPKALTKMRTVLKSLVKSMGDKRMRYFEFPLNIESDQDATGCEWHPDADQDTTMAKQLTLTIQDVLQWQ